jgi:chromosomal replication initiator protein
MHWPGLKQALESRLNEQAFATWIQPMRVLRDDREALILGLPDIFGLDWVTNHYRDVLEEELRRLDPNVLLELRIEAPSEDDEDDGQASSPAIELRANGTPALPRPGNGQPEPPLTQQRYTFANFITGPSNQLAAAAAHSVSESPGRAYNPLFVFGKAGLGKTHLIHAVGHEILRKNPKAKVQYQTTEQFVNDVVNGIQTKRMADIRRIYRACDVLLIDDIQFIAGKEASQDEFFHTFNTLHAAQKQVVVTSDKLPHEIRDLEERIRSRFQWGLIVDLQPPELETRLAIVRKKAEADGIPLTDDVAMFIAQSVRSNVRELEGCLIRVSANASLSGQAMTVELAKTVLKDVLPTRNRLTCDGILKATAQHFDVKIPDLKSSKRARAIALPRQIAMYLCRKLTSASYPEIGRALGGRDHTTAINAFKRVSERLDEPELRRHVEEIEQLLQE